jgi:ADP-ribose pyrophosphatase YjhB (NUDIX family)
VSTVHRADWRHCPRCAGLLEHGRPGSDRHDLLRCPACGLEIHDNPAPTASALVVREGRLLLTRRAREPRRGMWDAPGGFIDPGEHPEDALVRELAEETGLEIEVLGLVGFFLDRYGEDGVATLNVFYEARVAGGRERPADDVSEIGWFPLDALPLAEIAFENGREAIAALLRREKA